MTKPEITRGDGQPSHRPWGSTASGLDLYPPVTMPAFPPTWDDVERLALDYSVVHQAVSLVHRGDWTREQALIMVTFALACAFQQLFKAELERVNMTLPERVVFIKAPDAVDPMCANLQLFNGRDRRLD